VSINVQFDREIYPMNHEMRGRCDSRYLWSVQRSLE